MQPFAPRTLLRAPTLFLLIGALLALLIAACGGDDNGSASPTASGGPTTSAASPTGSVIATPQGTDGAPAVCTQQDAQRGTITTLDFNNETGTYDSGEDIEMTFTIANCGDNNIKLAFTTTQRYVMTAQDAAGNEVWSSAHNKVYDQVLGEEVIEPLKTIVYTETWDQKSNAGEQVPDGTYKISAFSIGCSSGQTDCHFGPIRYVSVGQVPTSS